MLVQLLLIVAASCFGVSFRPAAAQTTMTLARVQSFDYVIAGNIGNPGYQAAIGGSPADLVITGGSAPNSVALDRQVADPNNDKIILGYVDVVEASKYSTPDLFQNGNVPSWFGNQNPGFPGLYTVQYWNPAWEPEIFRQIDLVIAQGFDGIFLDVLSGDNEWSAGNIEGNPVYPAATQALATLVTDLTAHVAAQHLTRPFYLVGNNPGSLALHAPASLAGLNGIFNEVLYYAQARNNGRTSQYVGAQNAEYIKSTLYPLYKSFSVPVFGNDYPLPLTDRPADFLSFDFYTSLGWVPSVTTAQQTSQIFATGPFMFMAAPSRPLVTGTKGFTNFLSGGLLSTATLVGGDQGDSFVGGPGRNTITGGAGNDLIYAHPATAALKNRVDLGFVNGAQHGEPNPSVRVLVNGQTALPPMPVTVTFATSGAGFQHVLLDTRPYGAISSLEVDGLDIFYNNTNDFNNVFIESLSYQGVQIPFSLGQYAPPSSQLVSNGTAVLLNAKGVASFPESAFQGASPFPNDTSDTIDGGGGTNTVVYRGPFAGYTIARQGDGSVLVTSADTAEGPDTLRNIQILHFTDTTVALPATPTSGATAPLNIAVIGSGAVANQAAAISCTGNCSPNLPAGQVIGLTATPATGWQFVGWGGACSGTVCAIATSDSAADVFASFAPAAPAGALAAAILPSSRSVTIGSTATAFATIINGGTVPATNCSIVPTGAGASTFAYQPTSASTNAPNGPADTPVTIPAGAAQSFVVSLTPYAAIDATNVAFGFSCSDAAPAPSIPGVNTLLLSAGFTATPDVVALAATPSADGILHLPGAAGANAFAVATVNVGSGGSITATAGTGAATLPLALLICQTDSHSGSCIAPPAPSATATINPGGTPTFSIFATASGAISLAPGANRIFVQFADVDGAVRGATSVAVATQ